jgi:hypothetical protein
VVEKVEQFAAEVRNPATGALKRLLALKFLLHFVGDLHQPLHAADDHDAGGKPEARRRRGTDRQPSRPSGTVEFVRRLG